ncbi:hypothetical protein EJF36_12740 [Bacillus sp. HMF5848]|uniref:hypothetical protein n=1 Tax=Bacillus sp. HMF5848 TaxID=2495421 RepID=UPI000F77D685|nr:hypothetical protein [Bacillus sp. HMF5848]RSK27671.1 hypothetical protein EJF36_12740 [Bacillus sp. HMF5848]
MHIIQYLSISTIIIGITGWIITFSVDPITSPFALSWQVTLIANPIGLALSLILVSKKMKYGTLLSVLNILLLISVFPFWFLTDLLNMLLSN